MDALREHIERLQRQRPRPRNPYYLLEYSADPNGDIGSSIHTQWVGEGSTFPLGEIRGPSEMNGPAVVRSFRAQRIPVLVVHGPLDLLVLISVGGFGLVEKSIAETFLTNQCTPRAMQRNPASGSFVDEDPQLDVPFTRAPSRELRMRAVARDRYRCRLCERSLKNVADSAKHVHRIVPWTSGGVDDERNLVTLCGECGKDLLPGVRGDDARLAAFAETSLGFKHDMHEYQRALARFWKAGRKKTTVR